MSEFDEARYESEAEERWGDTEAYRESSRRMKGYSHEDAARLKTRSESIEARMADLLKAGGSPDGDDAMALAEEARLHIDRWFYPCSHAMHAQLANLYTTDPRFKAHYEDRAPGLAAFVAEAIRANHARQEV